MPKFPMTPRGQQALRDELKRLREVERPKNVLDIEEARAHGDLKENAEYHAAKERQSFIEGRSQADGSPQWRTPTGGHVTLLYWDTGWLIATTGDPLAPAYYVMVGLALSLAAIIAMPSQVETMREELAAA